MRGGWVFKLAVNMFGLVAVFVATPVFALDPTLPPGGQVLSDTPSAAQTVLRLQAIVRGPDRVSAVINGQTLMVGDRLGDVRILAIRPHAVVIDRLGQQQELRLSTPIIQTSRTQP